ncbi:MAG TPA: efflux RND transporter periplasmic adaptor subunit [Anaerolineales bacterium]|nr:efflux RND transporter periplasmic adaptor subunit [Anaerolineales bacterium]
MTPKLKTSRSNRKLLWLAAVIIVIAALGGYFYYSNIYLATRSATGSEVQTAIAQRGDLVVYASGGGTLIAQTDASFGFETSGQVTEVYVKVGDQVEAGQVLAQLDDTLAHMEYVEAQQALEELYSAASIATVQQEIGTAQDTKFYAHEWIEYLLSPEVVEAEENLAIAEQRLAEAQTEATADPSDAAAQIVKQREQAVAYLQDKLTQAQEYYENYYLPEKFGTYENIGTRRNPKQVLATETDPVTGEEVPEIDEPSAADITTARNKYAQAQETVKEGELYLEALNTGTIPEGGTGEKLSTLYEAQLTLENAKSALDETQLIAPISGTVTALDLSVGEQVDTSSIITISQLSQPYTLEVYLDETDWSVAQVGNKVTVTFDLLPEQTYPGTVTLVYPELSESFESSLVHLIVQLDQSISQDLPAGTGVTVDVVGAEAQGVVLVPVEAIHETEDGKTVVTVLQNGGQSERQVELGLQNETYAEVKSGLEAGEIVVTE